MSRPKLALFVVALAALAALSAGTPLVGSGPGQEEDLAYVPGEVIVKFKPLAQPLDKAAARAGFNATELVEFRSEAQHWRLGPGEDVETAVRRLQESPFVEYAEPNYIWTLDVIPNDPRLDELWGMINTGQTGGVADADIDAEMAWSVSTGSHDVIVGVIDTGVDYNHPELAANIWTNPGEVAGNGVDDDSNGYIDDTRGWDFYNDDNDPFDDHGHGTHCSGTIGAIGDNGIGVAGVNWQVKIIPLKFLSAAGSGSTTDAVLAVDYAVAAGADLTSNSWGGGAFSQALYDAIQAAGAANQAFIAAAGNDNLNTDVSPHYPSTYDLPNIIAVAATDHNDAKAYFSNYGAVTVDLGAPGLDILSTLPGNSYGTKSGTSMATPHVAGVAALIRAVSPTVPVSQMKNIIMVSADDIPSMAGITVSGGRLNAFFAIAEPDDVPPDAIVDLAAGTPTSNGMGLTWTATGDDGSSGTASYYQVRYSTTPIDDTNWEMAALAPAAPTPAPSGSPESMEVAGLDPDTAYYFAIKAFDEWANPSPLSNLAMGTTLPAPTGDVAPTMISEALFTGGTADHIVTLSNVGLGTLDFTIPTPALGEPVVAQETVLYGKDELDPRSGDPILEGMGGPDPFGYRWIDSDEPGGPVFSWVDISATGTPVGATSDDSLSPAIALDFDFPFYGQFFDSIRVCSNGWLSFTSSATSYSNQPLPTSGAPENLVAPFWDDLNPGGVSRIFYQSFGSYAVVQWHEMPHYGTVAGTYTFQAILDSSGTVTYQYLTMVGELASATLGIQDATKTIGLQVAYNQAYVHDNMAVRIGAMPQWLSAAPTSGRLWAGESTPINVHIDASNLEGGVYPGQVNILTNDPAHPVLTVDVTLDVTGAPDAVVAPTSLDYGDSFLMQPAELILSVRNAGTDTLVVSDILSSHPDLTASPTSFSLSPREAQDVVVTWMPSTLGPFSADVTVLSNDAAQPSIVVPATGNAIPAPDIIVSPTSFTETLYTGETLARMLRVRNAGGSDLVVDAASFLGEGGLVVANDNGTTGSGGPDEFGYKWKDSDDPGGPVFNWYDISAMGTPVPFSSSDDNLSAVIEMGMTFPYYGNNFTQMKVSTNGWLTFDTSNTSSYAGNYSMPTTSGPENMIAMFWDDLHLRTGTAHYYNAGDRFIVQYTNIGQYSPSTGESYTFQVQLFPNGKIVLQYLEMSGTDLEGATIGVEDGTGTIGLEMVYNDPYVHDELAIQISRTPDWLVVTPNHAVIPPGGYFDFTVEFDATDRVGGLLDGAVVLMTNIPDTPEVWVPAALTVIGAPDVAVIPESYDYGTRFVGYSHLTEFQVVNNGTDMLDVSLVETTDPTLVAYEDAQPGDETPQAVISIPPGAARLFTLQWLPTAPATMNAEVRIHSDDPDTPILAMPVTGSAIMPPIAAWTPSSFSEDLMVGDVVARTLHLQNNGGSDLHFTTQLRDLTSGAVTVYPEIKLGDDEEDPRPGILGSGGPDAFGYKWTDSDEPGGPVFDWVDISSIGTLVPFSSYTSGQNLGPFPIGFEFPFYGGTFSEMNICSSGWVSFTNGATDSSNDPLPSTGAPENMLAVLWDLLYHDTSYGASVYYHFDGARTIVQFNNLRKAAEYTAPYFTFQVILYPSGNIVYQYLTLQADAPWNSFTVGIQNGARDDGLTVVFNDDTYLHDNMAIRLGALDWLMIEPTSGTVPAGGALDLDVTIDTTNLIGGDYAASIDMTTNDPAHGYISVPVSLHTTGIPDVDADPASLTFPTIYVGFSSSLPLTVKNVGTDVLHISDVTVSGDFAQSGLAAPVDVPAGGAIPITVDFAPTTDGTRLGVISIVSDDPDEPLFEIGLEGYGLFPPEIGSTPEEINTALPPGGTRTKTLTLHNTGGSDLSWAASPNIVSATGEVTVYDYLELGKEEEDPRPGILGSGGPDLYGYRWKDSDEPGGPVYDWVDISGIGTQIEFSSSGYSDDGNAGPFPLGFTFNFYGLTFNEFYACTNGWVSFTSTLNRYSNQPLPNTSTSVPENLLSVFWDDLVHRSGTGSEPLPSAVYYYYDGMRLIIQYQHMYRIANYSDDINFQIILYPSGRIVYQYETMSVSDPDSHTIGIQNATKDDGLTVVYNDYYVHDNMAIEISRFPEWVKLDTMAGVIPAGGSQELTVTLDAAGLEDGIHEATLDFLSNDPYTPMYQVPVSLNVSLVAATWTNFDPDVVNLSANGNYVVVYVELPPDLDPYNINLSSVHLNDVVPALAQPAPEYGDRDGNGIVDVSFKFDRQAVGAILPEGTEVPVWIQGEVQDVQWWRGTDTVRTLNPRVVSPPPAAYYLSDSIVPIRWEAPEFATPSYYAVHLSRDGGMTWEELATGVTGTAFDWTAAGILSENARVRVLAFDSQGLMGYDVNDGAFTIAGPLLLPPNEVEGGTLEVVLEPEDLVLTWKEPFADLYHGPVDHYRVLRSQVPSGPYTEVAIVTEPIYHESLAETASMPALFYRIVAANAAGDSE